MDESVYTVSKDGALFEWQRDELSLNKKAKHQTKQRTQKYTLLNRHFFKQPQSRVTSFTFHPQSSLLTVGFSTGIFTLYTLPTFTLLHTLSLSQSQISTIAMNPSGEWIAFGSAKLGQLLVWEWQSESHVLKQQSHAFDMSCLSYSPDGRYIATGGEDGKLKLWNTESGFSFVTFQEHTAAITAVEFAKQGQVVYSASLDGTVRAYDLIRYRNFKTFTSPTPVQFSSLALDPSGEVLTAGSYDTYDIYAWSVQTGKLLDIHTGHTGPISSLTFSPNGLLASSSWDKSIRTWSLFNRDTSSEPFLHDHEVLTLSYRPDGLQLCASTLDGHLHFWDTQTARLVATIEGRADLAPGRKSTDRTAASNPVNSKAFTTLCYTQDGLCVLAGGNSKYICIYSVSPASLLKRFQISHNASFDGMLHQLSSKNMTLAGPLDQIDDSDHSDLEDRLTTRTRLPGVQSGDPSLRVTRPSVRTHHLRFSPTSRSFSAATTEGLLIYTLDSPLTFDPFHLSLTLTSAAILASLTSHAYLDALIQSLRLGEYPLTLLCYSSTPSESISLLTRQIPQMYLFRFMQFLLKYSEETQVEGGFRLVFHLTWITALLREHGGFLQREHSKYASVLRGLLKTLQCLSEDLTGMYCYSLFCDFRCDGNISTIEYFLSKMAKLPASEAILVVV